MATIVDEHALDVDSTAPDCLLMKGNVAMSEAAIIAGCRFFFGYPITPQNEVPMYLSKRMPEVGGVYIQAESEVAAINMVYGAAAAGARVMTSSSSPGISLKQEGISYLAAAELPCFIGNIQRAGPGLGNITVAQSDYFQAVKGGGHGDYRIIVLAPSSVQEMAHLTLEGFDLADEWRTPVMLLADAILGQTSEPVILPKPSGKTFTKQYILDGCSGREKRVIQSLWLNPVDAVENHNLHLQEKYAQIKKALPRWEEYMIDDAEIILTAYGTTSRIVRNTIKQARKDGIKLGMIRPVIVWPFPSEAYQKQADRPSVKGFMTVEMSYGQMVEDVRLAVAGKKPVGFYGRGGGGIPDEEHIRAAIKEQLGVG